MQKPLMPKATAVWLLQNTTLTFEQIGQFCGLHRIEIQAMADGDTRAMLGYDPILNNQLTAEEIKRCEEDSTAHLQLLKASQDVRKVKKTGPKNYTPRARRQDRPDGILWLITKHPEMTDATICRLLGTTNQTIKTIRDKSHKRYKELKPRNPVTLGLCSQSLLDEALGQ